MESEGVDPWRKSSYSGGANGSCVEVARAGHVLVRDTADRDGGTLAFDRVAWARFTAGLSMCYARVSAAGKAKVTSG